MAIPRKPTGLQKKLVERSGREIRKTDFTLTGEMEHQKQQPIRPSIHAISNKPDSWEKRENAFGTSESVQGAEKIGTVEIVRTTHWHVDRRKTAEKTEKK